MFTAFKCVHGRLNEVTSVEYKVDDNIRVTYSRARTSKLVHEGEKLILPTDVECSYILKGVNL